MHGEQCNNAVICTRQSANNMALLSLRNTTIKLCTIDGIFGKSIERQTTPTTERVSEFTATSGQGEIARRG